jgi:hypothetical protein
MPHITLLRKADTVFPEFPITKTEEMECSSVSLMLVLDHFSEISTIC